ncbi:MAG: aromatic-ring-hydroxylating dioxygenase subunit beta [Rhodospirillales bacterium]|jgi:anthranilate 1,2-dioxygenase small subunit
MVDFEIEYQLARLNSEYVQCLDEDRVEEWPGFFVEEGIYIVHPRENLEANLKGYWIYCGTNAMMRDRIQALRDVNIFNIHYDRHLLSNVLIQSEENGVYEVRSNYAVIQSDVEGRCHTFSAGQYRDKIIKTEAGFKFLEKIVVVDSFNIDRPLAVPL